MKACILQKQIAYRNLRAKIAFAFWQGYFLKFFLDYKIRCQLEVG